MKRLYSLPDGWTLRSDESWMAILSPESDRAAAPVTDSKALDWMIKVRDADLVPLDGAGFAAFVERVCAACETCHGKRKSVCPSCGGKGVEVGRCDDCDHTHEHKCVACESGLRECPACRFLPVCVLGSWFDARKFEALLALVAGAILGAAVLSIRGGHAIVLGVGDKRALLMGIRTMRYDGPSWPDPAPIAVVVADCAVSP